ncbi:hypothetical protein BGW38_001612 [Lunasporangiospora selenospora]|uniref:CotH protein n=1 Tax=Lunasporangiospora selenospora TaxID=979761 RepID=A0A9P6FTH8_9FUNG|nr:hypothetical protein BGW38_001612 [Lunasporangiospora selenospora]
MAIVHPSRSFRIFSSSNPQQKSIHSRMKLVLGLVTIASIASVALADIKFNVLGYPSSPTNTFAVSIKGAIHKLSFDENTFPVWSGTIPGTDGTVEYSYAELAPDGKAIRTENFTKAFKQRQIATLHITGPVLAVNEMNQNPFNDKEYRINFRFISSKTIHSQRNVTMKTAGKSSKEHSKQSYKIEFDTKYNQTFFSRPNIKLRSMVMDPTLMREKVYIDMLNSAGVPSQQGAWVRLFINNEPMGLYLMVDDIKKSFLKQTVHGGDSSVLQGSLIQMNAFLEDKATLEYKGPQSSNYDLKTSYKVQNLGSNPANDPLKPLIGFMDALRAFDPKTTPDPVKYWTDRLDLDGFLRNMALEYLSGAFDNYWVSASNYFMYQNPTLAPGGRWQWLPTDADGTFGNGAPSHIIPSYKDFYDFKSAGDRPLVRKLIIECDPIRTMFEETLKNLVSTAFKPEAIRPRIQAYNKMLSKDAQWDFSLIRKSPGLNNNFTFEDFNNNVNTDTRMMTTGLIPWFDSVSQKVATDLSFTIPNGTVDRVPPPPKNRNTGLDNDDGDDEAPVDQEKPKGKGTSGSSPSMFHSVGMMLILVLTASVTVV